MDGLSEAINTILNNHVDNIARFNKEREKLLSKINFCTEHKLEEENRIALIKYDAMSNIVYNYENMFSEIQNAVNNWNS